MLIVLLAPVKTFAQALVGPAPYCMPIYGAWAQPCNQGGPSNAPGNWINDFINSFSTTGANVNITNNNSGCNAQTFPNMGPRNYFYHGCQHYMVAMPGQVIQCSVQSGNVYGQGFAVFIDWNNDGIFQVPGERVAATPGVPTAATFANINFTIPAAQPNGTYRMRVRCAWATAGNFIDPCNMHGYGEAEDYNIYIGSNPPGVLTATVTTNAPLCNGSQLNLNVLTSASPTTVLSYTWSGPGGFSSITNSTTAGGNTLIANAQPTNSGVYNVTVSPGSCPVIKQVTVNIYPTPTITALSNDGPVCQGTTLNIGSTATTSGTATYSWTGPNGFSANTQSASITNVQPVATGFYTLTVTNTYTGLPYSTNNQTLTCSATSQNSAAVVPVASLNVVPFFTLCAGSNLALTANAVGATSYSWSSSHPAPGTFTSALQNPVINNLVPANSGDYSVTAFYTSSQTTLVCKSYAVSNVSVVPKNPVTAFSSANVCQNGVGTFSASALNAAGYEWFGPNGYTSSTQTNMISNIQPPASGNYSVNAIFTIGTVSCTTSSFIPINVIPVPSVAVIPTITVCERQGASFSASAPNALT
ncbi:MAG: GEVED domain-containing protein, partial [Sphingobacteriaceae bacterium]